MQYKSITGQIVIWVVQIRLNSGSLMMCCSAQDPINIDPQNSVNQQYVKYF